MGKAPPQFLGEMGKAPPPLPAKSPLLFTKAPPPPPPPGWTGFYIGGDAGAAWANTPGTWNPLPSPTTFGSFPITANDRGTAFLGGAHAGYDDQVMPDWVAGFEGDWMWTKAGGGFTQPWIGEPGFAPTPGSESTMSANLSWLASARARVGYLVTPDIMAYATGGAAWARVDYSANANNTTGYFVSSSTASTQSGYTVGGGVEWMMTGNWSVRAEYLYYHFSKGENVTATTAASPTFPSNFAWAATTIGVARAGLTTNSRRRNRDTENPGFSGVFCCSDSR